MQTSHQPAKGRRFFADLGIVAKYEALDALRSRWAIVLMLLMLIASVLFSLGSIWFIQRAEERLSGMMMPTADHGASTVAPLWRNKIFRDSFGWLVGDRVLAEQMYIKPPLAAFFGLFTLWILTPIMVTLTAAPRLAEEVWTGSVRFVVPRTSRLAWCLGKYAGQAILLLGALLLSVPAAWLCGLWKMTSFAAADNFIVMLSFVLKAWIYGLAYLGLATCVSLLFRSPRVATSAAAIAYFGSVFAPLLLPAKGSGGILDLLRFALPSNYYFDLLSPDVSRMAAGAASLSLLGLVFLFLGYLRFSRRDL